MAKIGGNLSAEIRVQNGSETDAIGTVIPKWEIKYTLLGFLDLMNGDSKYNVYDAKVQESTHIFLADYVELTGVTAENSKMFINSKQYDVMLIDDPMELHDHLEIYLKYTGG